MIHLGKMAPLPAEIVTQTIGILAKRRAGKSYTARRFTEQLCHGGHQVVIVDPKGDWWGIRSSANGKAPGLPITILGGERGDVPLEKAGGELVAKLVVEERVSALLDLSHFRKGEVAVFMADFLETLYRLKAREKFRTPVMLVIDEADAIAPQKPQHGEERMLGAAEDIVRRGGQRGIGCTMISQRSAVLNKNILTQIQVLIALRTIAPQDLKALDAWIDVHGTEDQRKKLMGSLPALPVGDAWIWSPGWPTTDGIFERVHVLPIETFDSGASPKPGEKCTEPKALAEVDLEAIRRQMADVVQRAAEADPKKLRARIAQLEAEAKKPAPATAVDHIAIEKIRVEAIAHATRAAEEAVAPLRRQLRENVNRLRGALSVLQGIADNTDVLLSTSVDVHVASPYIVSAKVSVERGAPAQRAPRALPVLTLNRPDGISGGCLRMLVALASRSPAGFTIAQWATLAKLKRTGGTWSTYLSRLRVAELVEQRGDLWFATDAGLDAAGEIPPAPESPSEILEMWKANLGGGPARMLDALSESGDRGLSLDALSEAVGITRSGGTFGTYLSRLRANGLVENGGDGIRLTSVVR